jgi:hypothetical protein
VLTNSTRQVAEIMKAHLKQEAGILQEEEEEDQNKPVTTPYGHYMGKRAFVIIKMSHASIGLNKIMKRSHLPSIGLNTIMKRSHLPSIGLNNTKMKSVKVSW